MKNIVAALALLFASVAVQAQQPIASGIALPSAARTASVNSADIPNPGFRGVHVVINVTSWTSGTFTPTIQAKTPIGTYYTLLTGSAAASTQVNAALCTSGCVIVLKVFPAAAAVANVSVSDFLPSTWRVQMTGASTPSATFSVSFLLEQ